MEEPDKLYYLQHKFIAASNEGFIDKSWIAMLNSWFVIEVLSE